VRMLSQWDKPADSDKSAEMEQPVAQPSDASRLPEATWVPRPMGSARPSTVSPAVSGILRLRERATTSDGSGSGPASTDPSDLDDELIWAREIFQATGGRV